jgi:hypothetical protein
MQAILMNDLKAKHKSKNAQPGEVKLTIQKHQINNSTEQTNQPGEKANFHGLLLFHFHERLKEVNLKQQFKSTCL